MIFSPQATAVVDWGQAKGAQLLSEMSFPCGDNRSPNPLVFVYDTS